MTTYAVVCDEGHPQVAITYLNNGTFSRNKEGDIVGPEGQRSLQCPSCSARAYVSVVSAQLIAKLLDEHPELTVERLMPLSSPQIAEIRAITMLLLNRLLSRMPQLRKAARASN